MCHKMLVDWVRALKETPKGVDNMCRELEQIYLYGEKRGIEKGRVETHVDSIKNLMTALGWSIEVAMDILKIPKDEWTTYIDYRPISKAMT